MIADVYAQQGPSFRAIDGNAGCELPHEILFFDTETTQTPFNDEHGEGVINHLQFGVAEYVRWRNGGHRHRLGWSDPQEHIFTTAEEFWDVVEGHTKKKSRLWVMAHNLGGFDLDALGALDPLLERGWVITKFIIECPPFVIDLRRDGRTIRLIDSLNYTRSPLAVLGKAVGIPKGEDPGVDRPMEERLDYCRTDVRILRTFILSYVDFIQEHDLGNYAMTGASQAMNAWRHRFAPKYTARDGREKVKVFPTQGPEYETLERLSYFAGRTGCDFIGTVDERVTCYDVNSLFPAVMKQHRYPYTFKAKGKDMTLRLLRAMLDRGEAVIATVVLNTDVDWYPYRGERVLFPVGEFETTLCTGELQLALDHGHIVTVGEWQSYKTADLFSTYVDFFYHLRQQYKAEGNTLWEYICKVTFLNSLYGKFGQKTPEWVDTDDPNIPLVGPQGQPMPPTFEMTDAYGITTMIRHMGDLVERKLPEDRGKARNAFVAIAAHVTSYARLALLEGMQAAGRENVLYYDTDSLFVLDPGRDALEKAGMLDPIELGKFKLEKEGPAIIIRGAKDYVFGGVTKTKGVRRLKSESSNGYGAEQIGPNTYAQERFRSFRGSVYHNTLGKQMVFREIKTLSRIYTKGIVQDDGRVTPIVMTRERKK